MSKKDITMYCFIVGYIVIVFSGIQLYFGDNRTSNLEIQIAVGSKQVACCEEISSLSSCDMYSLLLK